jgi:uncharacterized protein YjbJ (UPF0337 family)
MNREQVHGSANYIAGKFQEEAGKLFGSKQQQLRGLQKQVLGAADRTLGNAREANKESKKLFK